VIERPDLDYGLYLIDKALSADDRKLQDFGLPQYQNSWARIEGNPQIRWELAYDCAQLNESATRQELLLNVDQQAAYDCILHRIRNDPTHAHFFLYGPGGTGKTFLYTTICERLRSESKIVLCVASTGIASLLLPGGRTAHKCFRIPIDLTDDSTCFIQ